MTVRHFTGDITNIDLSEFMSIESTGAYSDRCSTCRKDDDLGIIQVWIAVIIMTIAAAGMVHFFKMSLESPTMLSIVGTTITSAIWLTSFWFFMPREGGNHRYIRAWSKLPIIGPKLEANVALAKIEYNEEIAARIAQYTPKSEVCSR